MSAAYASALACPSRHGIDPGASPDLWRNGNAAKSDDLLSQVHTLAERVSSLAFYVEQRNSEADATDGTCHISPLVLSPMVARLQRMEQELAEYLPIGGTQ